MVKEWTRAGGTLTAAVAGVLVCALAPSPWPELAGLPLLLGATAWGLSPLPGWATRLRDALRARPAASWGVPLLLLTALVCLVYHPLLLGHMPWAAGQADHPTHQYQAWLLVERMLPTGRLSGWSDLRWAGYPALELYPIGGPLWVALFRGLTLGLLDWEATYALAILAMLVANVLSVYVVTRRLSGPWAALLAAALVLFERGWPRQGGDHFAVDVGVWPVTMGVGPLLLSLERLWSWLERRAGGRALAGACALAGWALLCHPLYLPVLIIAAPCVLVAALLRRAAPDRAAAGVAAVLLLGLGLAAFWYGPLLAFRALSEPGGAPFRSLDNLGDGLAMASVLPNFWVPALVLAGVGLVLAVARGGGLSILGFLAISLLLASSSTPLELSRSLTSLSASVQQERFLIPARVIACLLAAHGAAAVLALAARTLAERPSPQRRLALLVGVVLLAPLSASMIEGFVSHFVVPVVEVEAGDELAHRRDLLALCRWMRAEAGPTDGSAPPPRTAWYVGYGHHEYDNMPVWCGLAQIIDTPAETFALRPGGISEREVRAFGVRWVIGDRPIEGRDDYLRLVRRFGALHVYEVRDYTNERVTVLGPGRATIVSFSDELIRLRVEGATAATRIVVHVTRHRNWQARRDGRPVPITGGHLGLPRADLMHLRVGPGDGEVELRYQRGAPYLVGAAATLLSALLVGFLGLALSCRPLAPRLARWSPWASVARRLPAPARAVVVGALALAVLGAALRDPGEAGTGRAARRQDRVEGARPGERTLADLLPRARVWLVEPGEDGRPARQALRRRWDGRFGWLFPPEIIVDRHVEALDLGDPRRVLAARVAGEQEAHVRYPVDVIGAIRGVRGAFARGGRGQAETAVSVELGGARLGDFRQDRLGAWSAFEARADAPRRAPLEIVIRAAGRPGRAVLLDAALVP